MTDDAYLEQTVSMTGKSRRPLSPVHIDGRRPSGGNDIKILWKRRTRIGGDAWTSVEVPLAEESEAYDVEILDGPGGAVVRTISNALPGMIYTEAQQTADFGAPIAFPSTLAVNIHQLSASYGRGTAAEATLFFPLPVEV